MSSYKRYRVVKKVKESNWVVSLYLQPLDEKTLAVFMPGQHLMFKIQLPGQEIPAFRYYSFSDSYDHGYYRISVKKEQPAGLCSAYIFDTVKEGDVLYAKGPLGDFVLDTSDHSPVVLIAGGIGITPLLSMIKSVAVDNPSREIWFFYGVNERNEHSFFAELAALKNNYPNFHIHTFYTKVYEDDRKGIHYDFDGFVSAEIILQQTGNNGLAHYICGPPVMMKYITEALINMGVGPGKIYTESFTSAITAEMHDNETAEVLSAHTETTNELPWQVEFTVSGRKLPWDNRYKSILEFAEANDIEITSGCLFGDCGTCLTRLLSGEIKYTHPTMIQPDKGTCLPCSCVPTGPVVLKA